MGSDCFQIQVGAMESHSTDLGNAEQEHHQGLKSAIRGPKHGEHFRIADNTDLGDVCITTRPAEDRKNLNARVTFNKGEFKTGRIFRQSLINPPMPQARTADTNPGLNWLI